MDYMSYIKPELLALIPVLIAVGAALKGSTIVKDKLIPLILGITGMVLACVWVFADGADSIPAALFTGIVQGVLCAGAAVYGNQMFKQSRKDE